MRYFNHLIVSLALFALVGCNDGCNDVYVEEPIGATPLSIEPAQWEGDWLWPDDDGAVLSSIEVVDAENGVVRLTWFDDGDVGTTRVYLRSSGDWTFANIPIAEDGFEFGLDEQIEPVDEARYLWARLSRNDQTILWWAPDVDKFEGFVTQGLFPGREESSDVVLGSLGPEHYEYLTSEEAGVPFLWDTPGMLTLVAR